MAKKKHIKETLRYKKQQQKVHSPASRLQEAQQAFQNGNLTQALSFAEAALRAANDPPTRNKLQTLLAETRLRLAAASLQPAERLDHLDQALAAAPDQTRLHYQRALTCWRMGNVAQAVAELEFVARHEPGRPGLVFLRQLGQAASGEPWRKDGLSAAETNTLQLLQRLRQGAAADQVAAAFDGKPLLGNQGKVWALLLDMLANVKSAPLARWQALMSNPDGTQPNPLLSYYQGVATLRKGDVGAAQGSWQQAAQTIATPWLVENLLRLRRDLAAQWAQNERWQEIADLYAATCQAMPGATIDAVLAETAGIAYFHLGHAAAQANQWRAAVDHWRVADALIKSRHLSQNLALAEEALGNWAQAGEGWRETVRRRPRKADHPDYLTDAQVATLWQRAAKCYKQVEEIEEEITCLKNAVKYAPDDMELRTNLADTQLQAEHVDAAENELQRILESAPQHVPALMRLGMLFSGRYDRDPMPIWQRVLAVDPHNADARQALAVLYLQIATDQFEYMRHFGYKARFTPKKTIEVLETGLKELPDHPLLLIGLGKTYYEQKKKDKARTYYQKAQHAAPKDIKIADVVLHELLHVDGGALVKEIVPQVRQINGLRPTFWIEQGDKVLQCKLGDNWAEFYWNEALSMTGKLRGEDSPAATLVRIFDAAYEHDATDLARVYEQRLRKEHPASGAVEYIEAQTAYKANPKKTAPVLALLRKAQSNAAKAGEPTIAELAEGMTEFIKNPPPFGGGLGNIFAELFGEMDEEKLDAFRRFL